jgi:hypothetical protein
MTDDNDDTPSWPTTTPETPEEKEHIDAALELIQAMGGAQPTRRYMLELLRSQG